MLELDHKDGNNLNNVRENLRYLCPNCHSQTSTFRNRNGQKGITDAQFITALKENFTIKSALLSLNLKPGGTHYKRAKRLIKKEELIMRK